MFYFRVFANLKLFCRYGSRCGLEFRPAGGAHRPATSRVASCPSSYGGCRRDCVGGDPHADTSGGLEARPTLDRQVSIRRHYLLAKRTFRTDLLFVRRLSAAGLLPIARMVQATDEDEPAAPAVGDDGDVHAGPERSRRFPFDRSLLTALVDRWRPETHTFHLPFGEMAPTLQDVSLLLGLPIAGGAAFPQEPPDNWREDLLGRFQGVLPPVLAAGYYVFPEAQRHGPPLRWLSQFRVRVRRCSRW